MTRSLKPSRTTLLLLGILASLLVFKAHFRINTTFIYTIQSDPTNSNTTRSISSPSDWSSQELTLSRQQIRMKLLNDTCYGNATLREKTKMSPVPKDFEFFLADDKRRIIYCWVPKVACTNWKLGLITTGSNVSQKELHTMSATFVNSYKKQFKRRFGVDIPLSTSQGDFLHVNSTYKRGGLKQMNLMTSEQIQLRLDTYFKFVFVRDPFTRLQSAWRDKFMRDDVSGLRRRVGPTIIHKYREKNSTAKASYPKRISVNNNTLTKNKRTKRAISRAKRKRKIPLQRKDIEPTFEEFLRYVGDGDINNWHWLPQHIQTQACSVHYDFIGHFETLIPDSAYVLSRISSDKNAQDRMFPAKEKGPSSKKTRIKSNSDSYENIPEEVLEKIRKVYALDFALFGYDPYRVKGIS